MAGHLLATVNPEAAAEADSGWKPAGPPLTEDTGPIEALTAKTEYETGMRSIPMGEPSSFALPSVGMDVVYHLRDGDARNMRTKFPAVILSSDPETRTVSLVVMVDAGDLWRQDRVPQYAPPEAGWDWISGQGPMITGTRYVAELTELVRQSNSGTLVAEVQPQDDFPDPNMVAKMLCDLAERVTALEAKRGPGRPAKPKEE